MRWLRFPRVLGLIVCVYLLGIAGLFGLLSTQSYRFVHNAATTQGTVVELVNRPTAGSTRSPGPRTRNPPTAPKVTYVVNDTTYTYTPQHGSNHQKLKVGDTVTVQYDQAHPAVSRLRGEGRILLPLLTSGFVTAAIGVGAVLFWTRRVGQTSRLRPSGNRELEDDLTDADGKEAADQVATTTPDTGRSNRRRPDATA